MNFTIHHIGSGLQEMKVDEIDTGTMDEQEAVDLACKMISAAEDLLWNCGRKAASDMCGKVHSELQVETGEVDA